MPAGKLSPEPISKEWFSHGVRINLVLGRPIVLARCIIKILHYGVILVDESLLCFFKITYTMGVLPIFHLLLAAVVF